MSILLTILRLGPLVLAIFFTGVNAPAQAQGYNKFNRVTVYDRIFSKYSKRNFGPAFNWTHFKAQAIAESGLEKGARSTVGAVGVMQIMPATFNEITKRSGYIKGSRNSPEWNIAAGIDYDRSIWNLFKAQRPFQDKLDFMFGAYNAGKGNIFQAQREADKKGLNPNSWQSMEETLLTVTGRHSRETLSYVEKIKTIMKDLNR